MAELSNGGSSSWCHVITRPGGVKYGLPGGSINQLALTTRGGSRGAWYPSQPSSPPRCPPPPQTASSPTKYWLNSVFSFSASFSVFLSWLCRRPHLLWLFGFAALDFARGSIMGSSAGGVPMRTRAQRPRGALANAEGSIDPRWRVAGEKHSRAAGHNAGLDVSSL